MSINVRMYNNDWAVTVEQERWEFWLRSDLEEFLNHVTDFKGFEVAVRKHPEENSASWLVYMRDSQARFKDKLEVLPFLAYLITMKDEHGRLKG